MRRNMLALVALGGLVALATSSRAGEEAATILDKAAKAHLGKSKAKESKGYRGKNKGTLHVQGLELEFTQEITMLTAGKFKEIMELSVMGQEVKTATVFNGKEGWIKVSAGGNNMDIPVKDEILEEFKETAYMMVLGQFSGLKDKGMKFSIVGEAQVNGKPAIGVKISKEGKKDLDFYFDKKTHLLAKSERRARDFQSGQEVTEERIVTEYREVDGRMMPKRVTVNRDGKKLMDVEVLEARSLDSIDDSEFVRP